MLGVALLLWFRSSNPEQPADILEDTPRTQAAIEAISAPTEPKYTTTPIPGSKEQMPSASTEEANSVEEIISGLQEAGARSDPASFQMIVANLSSSHRDVRRAALDATIQFGSRDAIPLLSELAAKTEDAREKVEILDAAELLELPSLSEIRQKQREKNIPPVVVSK